MTARLRRLLATMTVAAACAISLLSAAPANAAIGTSGVAACGARPVVSGLRPAFASDCPTWIGWGRLSSESAGSCVWRGCMRAMMSEPITVWYWNGYGWNRTLLADRSIVYVYPYAAGWTWVWTGGHWFAVQSSNVMTTT